MPSSATPCQRNSFLQKSAGKVIRLITPTITGSSITLTLQKTERQARLIVSNAGVPIPAEQLGRLFERFYRADASRGEQSGFGLGLPIAAAIAAEHRGTLKAESDAVSTRFIFTMPLKK